VASPDGRLNPAIDPTVLAREFRRSEETFRREYLAEFTDSIEGWISPTLLDQCVVRNRSDLPFQPGVTYSAALDPASRGHDFALAVLHKSDETIIVDKIACWTGTKSAPLAFERVLGEVKSNPCELRNKCSHW